MLIRNTSILSLWDLSVRPNVDILIKGSRITRIGQGLQADGVVLDGQGFYVIPGLANCHAHTAMTLFRGVAEDVKIEDWFNKHIWVLEKNLTPEDVYVGTLLGAAEMLLSGTTFVADTYFYMEQAARAYQEIGMRADICQGFFGFGDHWKELYQAALRFSGEYRNYDPRVTVSLGPHSPYLCPDELLRDAATRAEDLGLKLHIHVSEEAGQVARSLQERGMTPIEVLKNTGILRKGTILAHAYHATDKDMALIRDSGSVVAHCPKTYMRFGDMKDFLPRALRAGVVCGLGSDGPASNSTMNLFEAARDAALLAKCATRDPETATIAQVLPLLTRGGQALLGDGIGQVEEGAIADLVMIQPATPNMQPEHNVFANLLHSLGERNVHTVIVDGRVVVRDGKLVSLDLRELFRKAAAVAQRLGVPVSGAPMQMY